MELIAWGLVILVMIAIQYYIIEIKKRYPLKLLWILVRTGIALGFMFWYSNLGYVWYWSLLFLSGSFWLPFNEGLNLVRGKPFGYLSSTSGVIDPFIVKNVPKMVYVSFALLITLFAVGNMIIHGQMTWSEINNTYLTW